MDCCLTQQLFSLLSTSVKFSEIIKTKEREREYESIIATPSLFLFQSTVPRENRTSLHYSSNSAMFQCDMLILILQYQQLVPLFARLTWNIPNAVPRCSFVRTTVVTIITASFPSLFVTPRFQPTSHLHSSSISFFPNRFHCSLFLNSHHSSLTVNCREKPKVTSYETVYLLSHIMDFN